MLAMYNKYFAGQPHSSIRITHRGYSFQAFSVKKQNNFYQNIYALG